MGYKFLKFSHIYEEYEKSFLNANPDYQNLSFKELNDRYIHTNYGRSDFFMRHLWKLGDTVFDFTPNFKLLQTAWAKEHGINYDEKNWQKEIVFKQVEYLQPDVIFLLADLSVFNKSVRNQLREICEKNVKIVAFHTENIINFQDYNDFDLFCTGVVSYIERLKKAGGNPFLLPHAFEHDLINHVNTNQSRDLDFIFAGSLGSGIDCFSLRYYTIEKLLSRTPLEVWGRISERNIPSSKMKLHKNFYKFNRLLINSGIPTDYLIRIPLLRRTAYSRIDPADSPLNVHYKDRFHEPVFGLEYFSLLARAKIVLNIHGEIRSANEAANMRLFEATGMGACLITDWKENIQNYFEPDEEIVTFKSIDECVEKVNYLLENEYERQKIARAGQMRTLKDHTWEKRTETLKAKIMELI